MILSTPTARRIRSCRKNGAWVATLAAGWAGGLTGGSTAEVLARAQIGKAVVENNSLAEDKARESLKGSNVWWKQRVRETLGESQITNGVLNALAVGYWRRTRRLMLLRHWPPVAWVKLIATRQKLTLARKIKQLPMR